MTTISTEHYSLSTVDTPLGELALAASDRGLYRVAFPSDPLHLRNLIAIRDNFDGDDGDEGKRISFLERASEEITEYFSGDRQHFDIPFDLNAVTGFKLSILENIQKVPFGSRVTYSELAAASGNPAAIRPTGTACATNPIPILIPCHRVTRSGGLTGSYIGGIKAKEFLLNLER